MQWLCGTRCGDYAFGIDVFRRVAHLRLQGHADRILFQHFPSAIDSLLVARELLSHKFEGNYYLFLNALRFPFLRPPSHLDFSLVSLRPA